MKTPNTYSPYILAYTIALIAITLLSSCLGIGAIEFSQEDLQWFKPYSIAQRVIYTSDKGEYDTITFHKIDTIKYSVRNIEQGFYDNISYSVPYEFSEGSYHQFATMSGTAKRYDQDIIRISKSSSSNYTDKEIIFIGMIYDNHELKTLNSIGSNTYYFDNNHATYPEVNVVEGIKDFNFNCQSGIINYTDIRGVKWHRMNTALPQ